MPALLRSPGYPGTYSPTVCTLTDAEILARIEGTVTFWAKSHPNKMPPTDLLVLAYRNAWTHFMSPRRKRLNPRHDARDWANMEVSRLCAVWISQRPDREGAWSMHLPVANWVTHEIPTEAKPAAKIKKAKATEPVEDLLDWTTR